MRHKVEFAALRVVVRALGALPRGVSRAVAIGFALAVYAVHGRLRKVGMRNLEMAFPEMPAKGRRRILRGEFVSLGRQLAEFCLFPSYTPENVGRVVIY